MPGLLAATSKPSASTSATKRLITVGIRIFPAFGLWGGGGAAASWLISERLRALPAALVGLGIVVSAFQLDPIGDQILRALELLGPGVTGHQAFRLPNDVELPIPLHLADEHRLGDVVVGEHHRGAAGEVRR